MKIQEALEDFIHGGIMFPSSKTSYIEENTLKDKEYRHFSTGAHTRRGARRPKLTHRSTRCIQGGARLLEFPGTCT